MRVRVRERALTWTGAKTVFLLMPCFSYSFSLIKHKVGDSDSGSWRDEHLAQLLLRADSDQQHKTHVDTFVRAAQYI